jgi:hypothetical protein
MTMHVTDERPVLVLTILSARLSSGCWSVWFAPLPRRPKRPYPAPPHRSFSIPSTWTTCSRSLSIPIPRSTSTPRTGRKEP